VAVDHQFAEQDAKPGVGRHQRAVVIPKFGYLTVLGVDKGSQCRQLWAKARSQFLGGRCTLSRELLGTGPGRSGVGGGPGRAPVLGSGVR
jgi:hypothetical protein